MEAGHGAPKAHMQWAKRVISRNPQLGDIRALFDDDISKTSQAKQSSSKAALNNMQSATTDVTVIVSFQAKPGKAEALLAFLSSIQPSVIEAGCKSISLLQDKDQKNRVFEIEQWASVEAHQQMVQQAETAGAFAPFAELLEGAFEVHYLDTVQNSKA